MKTFLKGETEQGKKQMQGAETINKVGRGGRDSGIWFDDSTADRAITLTQNLPTVVLFFN